MLELALMGSAFLMGMAGSVHCVSMCAAPCAAVTGGQGASAALFHGGRLVSYSLAGAVAASSIGLLWQWEQAAAWLKPVWLALHLAVLALGLWLLWRGEQPLWMQRRLSRTPSLLPSGGASHPSVRGRSAAAGLAWVAWPCGLLQSALMVATLATGPVTGAMVMAAFAIGSSPGLWAAPWLLRRLAQTRPAPAGVSVIHLEGRMPPNPGADGLRWATRLSGLLLSAAALWALGHGLWVQIRAYCG
ncbi:sulfite exporter TauE/SafE family protein [Roseateles terrae]|uniref:Urease accessory protein UreH-like transmembrane domain-containing protein n=1 Tax=Roseateles terrae TaxID=431060 RepID=A0ABR6GNZ2_9BURK|nr:sulfite exporter TauE/SafE family protein [Roseateles terrae]MBB3193834.1 hypothetical protein [Roseateles terrae]OWQ89025.1 hypothetical protein CDN98_00225 [Roseateles terrae]